MAGNLVTVATFDKPAKARLAQNALEAAGIKAAVTDETVVAMDWLLGAAVGWVKVQVMEEDAERAVAVLEEALGAGTDPVDPEALAAEAEAAAPEDGSEPPELPPTTPPPDAVEAPILRVRPPESGTPPGNEAEPPPSERDEYARRFFYASVFALAVAPFWFYAIYLFLNAAFGEGPLAERSRSRLLLGGSLMVIGAFLPLLFCLSYGSVFS